VRGNANKDVRAIAAAQPVVELGDDAAADGRAEFAKRARTFRNRDTEDPFARFADFGALGDET
jgi:hypothetical protein